MGILMRYASFLLLAALLALAPGNRAGAAEPGSAREYQIKAAFLYNFTKFVSWPEDGFSGRRDPLRLCIMGRDPFGSVIDISTKGKLVKGRAIMVRRVQQISDVSGCHLLFVSASENGHVTEIVDFVSDLPILTVADGGDFAKRGGIINLVISGNKIRFEINPHAASRAGLQLSAQLLKLARIVDP